MHPLGDMRRLLVLLVATISLALAGDGHAERTPRPPRRHGTATRKHKHRPARRPARNVKPPPNDGDELVLSPSLLRQLQHHLADAGYLAGRIDGRLDRRTRHALAQFQNDYHLAGHGHLDRKTAEALLGSEVIGAYTLAAAPAPHAAVR